MGAWEEEAWPGGPLYASVSQNGKQDQPRVEGGVAKRAPGQKVKLSLAEGGGVGEGVTSPGSGLLGLHQAAPPRPQDP